MSIVTIDGVDYEVTDQAKQVISKMQSRIADLDSTKKALSDAEKEKEDLKKEKEDMEKEKEKEDEEREEEKKKDKAKMDSLQAKLDDAIARAPTPETLDALVESRLQVVQSAQRIVPNYDAAGKDCEVVRKEIVADKCPDVDVEKVSADYIRARFDAIASGAGSTMDAAVVASRKTHPVTSKDGATVTADEARAKAAERNRNAWKRTTGGAQ